MTFEPTKLSKPDGSLENEEKSVAILRSRVDSFRPTDEHDDGRAKALRHAEDILDAYSAWLSDTSKPFTVTEQHVGEVRSNRGSDCRGTLLTNTFPRARCKTS